jgi:hypothetical protein
MTHALRSPPSAAGTAGEEVLLSQRIRPGCFLSKY